jgi:hypothetical protein
MKLMLVGKKAGVVTGLAVNLPRLHQCKQESRIS